MDELILVLLLGDVVYGLLWVVFGPRVGGDKFWKRFFWVTAAAFLFLALLIQMTWRASRS